MRRRSSTPLAQPPIGGGDRHERLDRGGGDDVRGLLLGVVHVQPAVHHRHFGAAARQNSGDNYPPFNIERLEEDRYRVTLAVAGFREAELEITAQQALDRPAYIDAVLEPAPRPVAGD